MNRDRFLHTVRRSLLLLLAYTVCCVAYFALFTVTTLHEIADGHKAHALSFVPAKRLTNDFERELLNARIFFIDCVTIQTPGAAESGRARFHNAESRLNDIDALVQQHPELDALKAPAAQLRQDVASYSVALNDTLDMVKGGELKGPRYDAQVKLWAGLGATMEQHAGDLEKLTSTSSEANINGMTASLRNGQSVAVLLLVISVALCLMLTLHLMRKIASLIEKQPESGGPAMRSPTSQSMGSSTIEGIVSVRPQAAR